MRELHGRDADAAGRAVHQHGLAGFRLRAMEQRAIRRRVRHAHRRALAERNTRGETVDVVEVADRFLRIRAAVVSLRVFRRRAVNEHTIARLAALDVGSDGFDFAAGI